MASSHQFAYSEFYPSFCPGSVLQIAQTLRQNEICQPPPNRVVWSADAYAGGLRSGIRRRDPHKFVSDVIKPKLLEDRILFVTNRSHTIRLQ